MLRALGWLLATVALGCTATPAAPPTAPSTSSPASPSSPAPSPVPSEAPSMVPSAVPSPSPTTSPVAGGEIVLRMQHSGGFLYPGMTIDAPPVFTLYRDGAVVYLPSSAPRTGAAGPGGGLRQAIMNGEQMDALARFALGPGGLAEARESYSDVPVADALTVNFTIDALGVSKSVSVYGLGDEMGPGPEAAHRERFKALADVLGGFEAEVARGNATDAGAFEPPAYRVTLIPDELDELAASADWPWDALTPDDFERDQSGFGVRVLTPEEAAPLLALPPGEIGDPVVAGPDGTDYLIRYRPLLSDELD